MRKMKKINGYLVVKFNARELREYEGTALGAYGVIDAELYTTCLVPQRKAFTISARLFPPPKPNRGTLSFSREPMTAQGQCPMWGFMWATG